MILLDHSLGDLLVGKLVEKAESIAELRKNIINYTNNFREFKNIKANLITELFSYENSFFQLCTIFRSVTENNLNYKNTFENLKQKHFDFENEISELKLENKKLRDLNENLRINILNINEFNMDKEVFIKNLISKVSFFENVIKDYQKKYYIPKYFKLFEFGSLSPDSEKIKKLFSNMKVMEHIKFEEMEQKSVALYKDLDLKRSNNDYTINTLNENFLNRNNYIENELNNCSSKNKKRPITSSGIKGNYLFLFLKNILYSIIYFL